MAKRSSSRNGTRATTAGGARVRTSRTASGSVRVGGAGIGGRSQTVSRGVAKTLGVTRGTSIRRTAGGRGANRPIARIGTKRSGAKVAAKATKGAKGGGSGS